MNNLTFSNKLAEISTAIVEFFDVFGQLPNFRVLNKSKQKSSVGFFLTIILMTAITSYLISEIISMLQKSQPSMIASEALIFDTSAFQLKDNNFTLALSVADNNNIAIDGLNKYYTMEIKQCSRKRIENSLSENITIETECTNIPFETCDKTHFVTDLQKNYFSKMRLGSLQCINRKFLNETPQILKGQLNSVDFHYLQVFLNFCQNTTEITTCAPQEEVIAKLQTAQYNIYSSDYLLQLSRSSDPLEQIITAQFSSFSATTSKKLVQYYGIVETISDDGLFFESTKTQANLKKSQIEQYQELYNGKYLINHYITISAIQTNYFRSYIKVQTILAKIGGIWQIILMVFSFLFRGFLYNLMLLKVSNKLFQIKDNSNGSSCCNEKQQKSAKAQNKKYFSFFDQIKIVTGFDRISSPLFQKARNEIMKNLDIVRIIKKLQRLEILSSLLLNEKQQQALVAISKLQIDSNDLKFKNKKTKDVYAIHTNREEEKVMKIELNSEMNVAIKNSNQDAIIQLYRSLKESQTYGFQGEINNKLIPILERIHPNSISDLASPFNFISQDKILEIGDDIIEPKTQKVK